MQGQDGFLKQFIKLAGPFWSSKNKFAIRKDTVLLIVLTTMQIGIAIVITQWNKDLFDALEKHSMLGVIHQVQLLIGIFLGSIMITTTHLIVKRRLLISWRSWLTKKVISRWMHKGRHYQVTFMSKAEHDNPDGRIAEDIRIVTEDAVALALSLFYSLLLLGSFSKILWTLSGTVVLKLGSFSLPVMGYLVWIAIIYSVFASTLGWWMGKPLTVATNARQTEEANYRHDLITAHENSQAIALIHGESNERERFVDSFRAIIASYQQQTAAWTRIQIFSSGYSVTSMALPILAAAPRYIAGAITLGTLMQSVQAFEHLVSALSWPVNNMAGIAKWRASVERVVSLVKALDELDHDIDNLDSHQICVAKTEKSVLTFADVTIASLEGETISATINDEIKAGEYVLISGDAGTGAKLFQAIADLWPWGAGHIEVSTDETLFIMPPRPYLPTGSLNAAIYYPKTTASFNRSIVERLLKQVGLKDLAKELDRVESWDQLLSREQQQRLGLVRVLLHRPKWVFVQEALDSLTPDGEIQMLELLAKELPDTAIVSITNKPTTQAFYQRTLQI
ncbi:ABC-type transport system, permease and ATPase component [Crenothrix polyspora]|uniref:ABC-type transport system, permease and ATPase component n=1 Tax=Crenothrix polyspora TaxID=360316 RepID=A0A1R4HBU3_9GAMM|nr:ABC transporter ATP-binding protein/permease [Crenothrix polyspora]SJM93689.1 ABC-type transport system, permease and ATPase component [Crenothrix polyspora]